MDVGYGLHKLEYIVLAEEYAESLKQAAKSHVLSLLVEWFPICEYLISQSLYGENLRSRSGPHSFLGSVLEEHRNLEGTYSCT